MKATKIMSILVMIFVVVVLLPMTLSLVFTEPEVSSELPDGYEIYTERCAEDMRDSVIICIALSEEDNRTIPVPFDETEISYLILSESNNVFILIGDESRSGVWKVSFYPDDDNSESDISWISREIVVGETITLPTGEKVTLLQFDEKGNPLFSVIAE